MVELCGLLTHTRKRCADFPIASWRKNLPGDCLLRYCDLMRPKITSKHAIVATLPTQKCRTTLELLTTAWMNPNMRRLHMNRRYACRIFMLPQPCDWANCS